MKLQTLSITNFKGIRRLDADLGGKAASVYGDNGTGKTTVYDAFLWVLFGKDSAGRADFSIQPLSETGEPAVPGADTAVEAVIDPDAGPRITLKRVYAQKWVRRHGEVNPVFTGHETACFIDGVPVTLRAYQETVDGLIPGELFRILTNPYYFNLTLGWKERRQALFGFIGGMTDGDIVPRDPRFPGLVAACGRRTVEEMKKARQGQARTLRHELEMLPVRKDEAARPILPDDDARGETERLARLTAEIADLSRAIQASQAEGARELRRGRAELELRVKELDADNEAFRQKTAGEEMRRRAEAEGELRARIDELAYGDIALRRAEAAAGASVAERALDALRARLEALDASRFEGDSACPLCGRAFPEEEIYQARAAWEDRRREERERLEEEAGEKRTTLLTLLRDARDLEACEAAAKAERDRLLAELSALKARIPALRDKEGYRAAREEAVTRLKETDARIAALEEEGAQSLALLRGEIAVKKREAEALRREADKMERSREARARVEERPGRSGRPPPACKSARR